MHTLICGATILITFEFIKNGMSVLLLKGNLVYFQYSDARQEKRLLCDIFALLCPKLSQMAALLFTFSTAMLLALFHLRKRCAILIGKENPTSFFL